ncbi:MAG: 4-hydroxybenzoate octaprenyltransferase [Paracoccaceae bacterium]
MTETPNTPEGTGQVSDAISGNWVDKLAPHWARPYLRLSRADRPIGTWLLLLPCWWGALLAASWQGKFGQAEAWIMFGCAMGAWLMRGAGCTWNDITDRNFDAMVERTRSRPIPSGQVNLQGAYAWLVLQLGLALVILLTFHKTAVLLGVASLVLVVIYPFAKRFTWWPQAFLGLAYNWGALLAWTAVTGGMHWASLALYGAGFFWTLFYDTIYAHQDTEDDALIGVKSTARLFGKDTKKWLRWFMMLSVTLLTVAIVLSHSADRNVLALVIAIGGPWAFGWHLAWQNRTLEINDPKNCHRLFLSNRNAGLIPVLFIAISLFL